MGGSKKKYYDTVNKSKKSPCDLIYISKWSFGTNLNGKRYVLDGNPSKKLKQYGSRYRPNEKDFGIKYQKAHQEDYHKKLKNVEIHSEDFRKTMLRHKNNKKVFAYLDPPYVKGSEIYKEKGVTPKEVCDTVKKMKGKVLVSYDNNPEVKKSCRGLYAKKVQTHYTLSANPDKRGRVTELLIANYPI